MKDNQQPYAATMQQQRKKLHDRIVLLIAALAMCRLWRNLTWLKSMTDTIGEMKHYIQTAYGDSTTGQNVKDWKALIVGIGQGNRAGSQIWVAVSTPLST